MRTIVISVIAVTALVTYRSAMLAAPESQNAQYPGQMTEARVYIQNRARGEAVAVTLQDVASDLAPLSVRLVNPPNVAAAEPLRTRVVQQAWEYQIVPVPAAANAMATLTNLGAQGWEVTGGFTAANGGAMLLLKRPRQ
jgi:hypothetical protein